MTKTFSLSKESILNKTILKKSSLGQCLHLFFFVGIYPTRNVGQNKNTLQVNYVPVINIFLKGSYSFLIF